MTRLSTLALLAAVLFPSFSWAQTATVRTLGYDGVSTQAGSVPFVVPVCVTDNTAPPQIGAGVAVPCGLYGTSPNGMTINGAPTESNTAIATTSTPFGTPGKYNIIRLEPQGQAMCVTFGPGTPTAPSNGTCAIGQFLAAGQMYVYQGAVPNTQGKAAGAAAGGILWASFQ